MPSHILFVDNDPDFLDTRAEFLERAGFDVLKVTTLSEAEWLLKNSNIHLAIIDIRLQDDDDDLDESGLNLVLKEAYRFIPKIVLTGHESADAVRIALKPQSDDFTPAVDFIYKSEEPSVLINAVKSALIHHVLVNWDLSIDWRERDQYSMVKLIEPDLEGKSFLDRATEFEDLFRRLFFRKEHIRVERLIWDRDRRLALIILAYKKDVRPESFVVVCGQNKTVNDEAQRFREFSPKSPIGIGTTLDARAETTHFAANAYTLINNDLEKIKTFSELYRSSQEKVFNNALTTLLQHSVQQWHQDRPTSKEVDSPDVLFRQRLGLSDEKILQVEFEKRVKIIENQVSVLQIRIERSITGMLTFHFNTNQSLSYAYDITKIFEPYQHNGVSWVINVPGNLTGENILTDDSGQTWLTDFAEAGLAPLLWNFVALEAIILFDWSETNDILRLQELEHCLLNTDFLKPDIRDLESVVRKSARSIQFVRKLAARTVGRDIAGYYRGILFQALRRFFEIDVESPLTYGELTRFVHILISIGMIIKKLDTGKQDENDLLESVLPPLSIDVETQTVHLGNQTKHLALQPFRVLQYLYENANRVCTTDELQKNVVGENYNSTYVHTLVGRIRETIERDPQRAQYLVRESNIGYRLRLNPK